MPLLDMIIDAVRKSQLSTEDKYWQLYLNSHPDTPPNNKEARDRAMQELKVILKVSGYTAVDKMYDEMVKARTQAAGTAVAQPTSKTVNDFKAMGFNQKEAAGIVERMASSPEVRRQINALISSPSYSNEAIRNIIRQDIERQKQLIAGDYNLREIAQTPWGRKGEPLTPLPSQADIAARFNEQLDRLSDQQTTNGLALK